jgi:protein AbiQ
MDKKTESLKFYDVDITYAKHLQSFEPKIPNIVYKTGRNKFLCGIVFSVNNMDYYAPISHKTNVDTKLNIKIRDNNEKCISSIRFQYMFPIKKELVSPIDIDEEEGENYRELLWQELHFCKDNEEWILQKAEKVYSLQTENTKKYLTERCCDFKLLEEKCEEYEPTKNEENEKENADVLQLET